MTELNASQLSASAELSEFQEINSVFPKYPEILVLHDNIQSPDIESFMFPTGKLMWPVYMSYMTTTNAWYYQRREVERSTRPVIYPQNRIYSLVHSWVYVAHIVKPPQGHDGIYLSGFVTSLSGVYVRIITDGVINSVLLSEWLATVNPYLSVL